MCACVRVFLWRRRWGLVRGGVAYHQISYLIWAASGGVKGAVGRLSSLRQEKKEADSRWSECERR